LDDEDGNVHMFPPMRFMASASPKCNKKEANKSPIGDISVSHKYETADRSWLRKCYYVTLGYSLILMLEEQPQTQLQFINEHIPTYRSYQT